MTCQVIIVLLWALPVQFLPEKISAINFTIKIFFRKFEKKMLKLLLRLDENLINSWMPEELDTFLHAIPTQIEHGTDGRNDNNNSTLRECLDHVIIECFSGELNLFK